MKAIILAAGRSRRLFPITHRKPKCLLPIGDSTLIDRLVDELKGNSISEIVLVVGFRAVLLEKHLRTKHPDVRFVFVVNEEYAETLPAYGFWLAGKYLEGGVLYLNSDVLCDPAIIREVVKHPQDSVTAIQKTAWDAEEVNVKLDSESRVIEIGKHLSADASEGEFIGVTKLGPKFTIHLQKALSLLGEAETRRRFAVDALNTAIGLGGELHAHDVTHYRAVEIDTAEDYERAKGLNL